MNRIWPNWRIGAALLSGISAALAQQPTSTLGSNGINTVLLISIDGMHCDLKHLLAAFGSIPWPTGRAQIV